MTINSHLAVLRRWWVTIGVCVAVCLGLAMLSNVLLPREYQAETTIYVMGRADLENPEATLSRIPSYQQLLTEDPVLEGAITQLGLSESVADLRDRLVVDNEPKTLLLKLTVSDQDPVRAATVANAVGQSFLDVAASLDRSPVEGQPPVVDARIVNLAQPPADPASPHSSMTLALGFLVGLVLGVVVAYARHARGWRIASVAALDELVSAPNLGTTAQADTDPVAAGADLHEVATSLRLLDPAHEHKVLVVTGPRPGSGATTTACNLAVALAAEGRRIALIDSVLASGRVAELMGLQSAGGLTSVLTGRVPLQRAMLRPPGAPPALTVLDTGQRPPDTLRFLRSPQMTALIEQLRREYEMVLFDAPALLTSPDSAVLAGQVDGVVLCCHSGRTSSRDVLAALGALEGQSAELLGTVLTETPGRRSDPKRLLTPSTGGRGGAELTLPVEQARGRSASAVNANGGSRP